MVQRLQAEDGDPGREDCCGHGEQRSLHHRKGRDALPARSTGAHDRRLEPSPLRQEPGEEEERRAREDGELHGGDQHPGARDRQQVVGAVEHGDEPGVYRHRSRRALVQVPLQRRDVLTKFRQRGDGDAARAEGRSPGEVCLGSRHRGECVFVHDEGAVGREVDRPLAAGLEPVAPPERITRIVDAVRAREPDVDLPGRVADGRERDVVAGLEAEHLRGRCRERRVHDVCSSRGRPVPGDQSCVLLETVVEAEHGECIRGAAASLGDGVGVGHPAPVDGHVVPEHGADAALDPARPSRSRRRAGSGRRPRGRSRAPARPRGCARDR